jgi:hypothetical protein
MRVVLVIREVDSGCIDERSEERSRLPRPTKPERTWGGSHCMALHAMQKRSTSTSSYGPSIAASRSSI